MGKLVQKNKDIFGKYHFIIAPLIVTLMGTLGYGEYEKRQDPPAVTVNVESVPAVMTAHSHRSDQDIQAMIDQAVRASIQSHTQGGKYH